MENDGGVALTKMDSVKVLTSRESGACASNWNAFPVMHKFKIKSVWTQTEFVAPLAREIAIGEKIKMIQSPTPLQALYHRNPIVNPACCEDSEVKGFYLSWRYVVDDEAKAIRPVAPEKGPEEAEMRADGAAINRSFL